MSETQTTNSKSESAIANKPSTRSDKGVNRFLFRTTIVIIVLGVTYIGNWYWSQYFETVLNKINDLDSSRNEHQQVLAELDYTLQTELETRKKEWTDFITTQQAWSDVQKERIDKMRERLSEVLSDNDYKWLYLETRYWIELAQRRLKLDKDFAAVTNLLVSAKDQLSVLDSTEARKIIAAIDRDLKLLDGQARLNTRQIYYQLAKLQRQLSQAEFLQTDNILLQKQESIDAELLNDDSPLYKSLWKTAKLYLSSLFSIQRIEDQFRIDPFDIERKFFIRKDIALWLEQAKLAVLDGRWQVARDNIAIVIEHSSAYLNAENPVSDLTELHQLIEQYHVPSLSLASPYIFQQQMQVLKIELSSSL